MGRAGRGLYRTGIGDRRHCHRPDQIQPARRLTCDCPCAQLAQALARFLRLDSNHDSGKTYLGTVAISAGICEEIVFRGWLLSTLHSALRLDGTALVLVAAALFGLAHSYQGITGMILTAFAGAVFCALYVATGSLLVPIALHILIDLRFAVLPAPRTQNPRTIYA
jgi:hypothetical protein